MGVHRPHDRKKIRPRVKRAPRVKQALVDRPISLGDVARALDALAPKDEATRRAIVGALGFELAASSADDVDGESADAEDAGTVDLTDRTPDPEDSINAGPETSRELQFNLKKRTSKRAPSHLSVPAGKPLEAAVDEDSLPPPPLEPLLRPDWSRAVVSTMARTPVPGGPPDVERMIAAACELHPLLSVPRAMIDIAAGADLLVESGENMAVFARDQRQLVHQARRVLGAGDVSVFRFEVSPARGVYGANDERAIAYRPPRPNWPVIMLTDFGIGRDPAERAEDDEWFAFAAFIRREHCRLIALVPYPPARWPAGVGSAMCALQWDRRSNVRQVRAALERVLS